MNMPAVSVIVPIYNVAPYVEAFLQSVCNQTFRDFELILVDDKGTDDTMAVATRFLEQHNFRDYRVVDYGSNKGAPTARNYGLTAARGEFVIFLDGDDTIEPRMLEQLYAQLGAEIDIAVCGIRLISPGAGLDQIIPQPVYQGAVRSDVILNDVLTGSFQCQIVKHLFRKSLFDGVSFPERVVFEDILTIPNLLLNARAVKVIGDPLYNYIRREQSFSRSFNPVMITVFPHLDYTIANVLQRRAGEKGLKAATKMYEHIMLFNISTNTIFAPDFETAKPILLECRRRLNAGVLIRIATAISKLNLLKAGLLSLLMVSPRLFLKVSKKILGAKK